MSVTSDGELGIWWREYYLHALGPLLMWIDAVFINRVFRRFLPASATLVGIVLTYVAWIELVIRPTNDAPVGKITSGLPYPFLNNLELSGRAVFYVSNVCVALVFLVMFAGLAWMVRRMSSRG